MGLDITIDWYTPMTEKEIEAFMKEQFVVVPYVHPDEETFEEMKRDDLYRHAFLGLDEDGTSHGLPATSPTDFYLTEDYGYRWVWELFEAWWDVFNMLDSSPVPGLSYANWVDAKNDIEPITLQHTPLDDEGSAYITASFVRDVETQYGDKYPGLIDDLKHILSHATDTAIPVFSISY